jgi:hypothetical protein
VPAGPIREALGNEKTLGRATRHFTSVAGQGQGQASKQRCAPPYQFFRCGSVYTSAEAEPGRPKSRGRKRWFDTHRVKPVLGPVFWLWILPGHLPSPDISGPVANRSGSTTSVTAARPRRNRSDAPSPTSRSSQALSGPQRAKLPPEETETVSSEIGKASTCVGSWLPGWRLGPACMHPIGVIHVLAGRRSQVAFQLRASECCRADTPPLGENDSVTIDIPLSSKSEKCSPN